MTKINIKNNKTKTATTILASLIIGLTLISPTAILPNVHAATEQQEPQPIVDWLSVHHHFDGCIAGNLKTGDVKEISCFPQGMHPLTFSWNKNIDCSSQCIAGAEFNQYTSYNEITGDTNIGSTPSSAKSQYAFAYWSGLTNCHGASSSTITCPTASLLVQSGWHYNATSGGSIHGPFMFAEVWGNFNSGSVNCDTNFCGGSIAESVNDQIYTANYADTSNSEWVAYAQDNSDSDYTSAMISFGTSGNSNSLPYPAVSQEAYNAPTTSYFPTSPVSFSSVTLYVPGTGQVNADTSHMQAYYAPSVMSGGISITVNATGTTTATIKNSW